MSRSIIAIFVFSLVLATGPLHGQHITERTKPTAVPSVVLPHELDRVLRDYERAWRKGDASALAALFAEDGFLLQSDRPPARGRQLLKRPMKVAAEVRYVCAHSGFLPKVMSPTSSVRTATEMRPAT